jgi:hypothetical protein
LLTVTEARAIGGTTATFDAVAEFDKSSGVRVDFGFSRLSKSDKWQLRRMKVVVPMPRADEEPTASALQDLLPLPLPSPESPMPQPSRIPTP